VINIFVVNALGRFAYKGLIIKMIPQNKMKQGKEDAIERIEKRLEFVDGCIELAIKNYRYERLSENGKCAYNRVIKPMLK